MDMTNHGMLHIFEDPGDAANCLPNEKKNAMNEMSPRFQLDPNTRTRTTPKWSRTLRIPDQNSEGVSHFFTSYSQGSVKNVETAVYAGQWKSGLSCTFN